MTPKIYFLCCFWFCSLSALAQLNDSFNDGDFLSNPTWTGNTGDFIINTNGQLQSNNQIAGSSYYLVTNNKLSIETVWEFWVQINFNPSSANYIDVWLISENENLLAQNNAGYFVRIGSTDDDICLYKKGSTGTTTKVIDGSNGLLNRSSSALKIKVIRTQNKFILLRDMTASGKSYRSEGEATDSSIQTSNYFGVAIKQSTSSFFQKHFFDDFTIKEFEPEVIPFNALSVMATSPQSMDIQFNQPVEISSASNKENYFSSAVGFAETAEVDELDGSIVHLYFSQPFQSGQKDLLLINGVKDVFGNTIEQEQIDFTFYKAKRYDVLIDEIFPDPQPQVGLPLQKFIELKNVSSFPISLKNWSISDGNSFGKISAIVLQPDSFLIVCSQNAIDAYKQFGNVVGVSNFPSMLVAGGNVILYNEDLLVMHAVQYDLTSYQNEIKKSGGYSLEMINTKFPCGANENWIASNDNSGGTPGRKNSVDDPAHQPTELTLMSGFLSQPNELIIRLNSAVDSLSASQISNYNIQPAIKIVNAEALPPFFNTLRLQLEKDAEEGKLYTLQIRNVADCVGNYIRKNDTLRFGITSLPEKNDLVINEILFNPKIDGVDYVELYNNSEKIIDLSKIYISNRNSSGNLNAIQQVSLENRLLFPSEYLLITTNTRIVQSQYLTTNPGAFIELSSMPSFPDEVGTVVILDSKSDMIDEVNYSAKWHFPLVKDPEGVSLERIRFDGPSDKSNFHSAAASVGFGTPGYKNSQSTNETMNDAEITVFPKVFSPDNDGTDDFLTIQYQFTSPGFVTNIKIFDASGRLVKYLEKNSLNGMKGFFRWDGLDDKNQKLPQGIYVLYIESFNKEGRKKIFKKTVVLARRI